MQDERNPYEPGHGPRRLSRLAIGVGVAAFLAMAGAGLAFAGSGPSKPSAASDPTSTSTSTPPVKPHLKGPRGFGPAFGPRLGGGRVIHGDYTIETPSGHEEILVQSGTVSAVSSTSITIASIDGFTHTYSVVPTTVVDAQANGINTVQPKDQVDLRAVVQSGKDTATNIVDITKIGSSRKGFFPDLGRPPVPPQSGAGTAAA
jgi:hypothetical protein